MEMDDVTNAPVPFGDGWIEGIQREDSEIKQMEADNIDWTNEIAQPAPPMDVGHIDLCFLCDCTDTMKPWIKRVSDEVQNIVTELRDRFGSHLRLAFVAYRDWCDNDRRIQTLDFTTQLDEFQSFVIKMRDTCDGGGDRCEDVLGGVAATLDLNWESPVRVLYHICDDPPHNVKYHSFFERIKRQSIDVLRAFINEPKSVVAQHWKEGSIEYDFIFGHSNDEQERLANLMYFEDMQRVNYDAYPNGHPNDPKHEDLLAGLKQLKAQYFIGKKTNNVDKMIKVFTDTATALDYKITPMELVSLKDVFQSVITAVSNAIMVAHEDNADLRRSAAEYCLRELKQHRDFKVIVGVDFGTDGTGFSFTIPGDPSEKVYSEQDWGDDRYANVKTKTNLLLKPNHEFVAFGHEAMNTYIGLFDEDEDEDEDKKDEDDKHYTFEKPTNPNTPTREWLFFEHFKMALYEDSISKHEKTTIKEYITATNGKQVASKIVLISAMTYIRQHIITVLQTKYPRLQVEGTHDVQWVLTVPAIWTDTSKLMMQKFAEEAGMRDRNIRNHFMIAYEPDCASVTLQYQIRQKMEKEIHKNKKRKQKAREHAEKKQQSVQKDLVEDWEMVQRYNNEDALKYIEWEFQAGLCYQAVLLLGNQVFECRQLELENSKLADIACRDFPATVYLSKDQLQQCKGLHGDPIAQQRPSMKSNVAPLSKRKNVNAPTKIFNRGEKYILADLGGGTADIACHQILSDRNVREIREHSGGAWGSTYIDKAFEKLIADVLGADKITAYRHKYPNGYMELLENFRAKKEGIFCSEHKIEIGSKRHKRHAGFSRVALPFSLFTYLEEIFGEEDVIEQKFEKFEFKGETSMFKVSGGGDYLEINLEVWYHLFDLIITPIIEHIQTILMTERTNQNTYNYLCLVGGFSNSRYLQYRMFQEFGKNSPYRLAIVIPPRPITAVLEGAARYGLQPLYIESRRMPLTYGLAIVEKYDIWEGNIRKQMREGTIKNTRFLDVNAQLIENKKYRDANSGEWMISDVFHAFVRRGDSVSVDDSPPSFQISPADARAKKIEVQLYCSEDKNPVFVTGEPLLSQPIELPQRWIEANKGSSSFPVVFVFGDTSIQIYIDIPAADKVQIHLDLEL